MARKSKAESKISDVIPEYVRESRLYQRRKVAKRKLPSFEEAMFLLHVPEMARLYFRAIYEGLKERDRVALEHAGEMLQYVQRKGFNINVAQQMLANNVAAGENSPVTGFDALVRQLAEARAGHALPAPAEVLDIRPAEITEGETQ